MRVRFEKIPPSLSDSFACLRFRGPAFICPYHQHPEIELLHIEKSRGRFVIGDTAGEFRPGQFFFLASRLPHLFHNERRGAAAWSSYIQFLPECLGGDFFRLPETREIGRLLERGGRGLVWEGAAARRAAAALEAVFAAQGAGRIARLLDLLEELAGLRGGRRVARAGYQPEQHHGESERLDHALAYVNESLDERIEAAEAARRVGLSVSGFGRFFQRHMGRPFVDYVIEQRMAEARRQLIESEATVSEICFRCGFGNLSNFNRHFLRRHGETPSVFRRRIRSSAPAGRVGGEQFA